MISIFLGLPNENHDVGNHLIMEDNRSDDHSLMVIEDTSGSKIVSGGASNILTSSVLESLSEAEEDDDSSSTADGGLDQNGGLDSGCGSTKAENSDVSSLSGGFAGKNESMLQNGMPSFNQGISSLGSNQSSSSAAMAAAMASAMAMMTPTSPRSVTTAGSMASASGRQIKLYFLIHGITLYLSLLRIR